MDVMHTKQFRELKDRLGQSSIVLESMERTGSGHAECRVRYGEVTARFFVASTPSDYRWIDNAIRDAKNVLRLKGADVSKPEPRESATPPPVAKLVRTTDRAPVVGDFKPARKQTRLTDQEKRDFYSLIECGGATFSECCTVYGVHPTTGGAILSDIEAGRITKNPAMPKRPLTKFFEKVEQSAEVEPLKVDPLDDGLLEVLQNIASMKEKLKLLQADCRKVRLHLGWDMNVRWL